MAITGIPTFTDGEIPPASKLNQLGDAITNKFGGAVVPSELAYPFVLEGNIDFDDTYSILGLRTFWTIINAGEYPLTAAGFQSAMDAAVTAGGGCVVIPPDTTITADGIDFDESNITIMGFGKSSELKLTTGASSGYLLRTGSSSRTNIVIKNLVLNGQSTGTAQKGVIVRRVDGFKMQNVICKNFTGVDLELTNDGTNGNSCIDAHITDCTFNGGSTSHIIGNDIDGLVLDNVKSISAGAAAIALEAAHANALMKRISMSNVDIDSVTGVGISILGTAAAASDNHSIINLNQCTVTGSSSDALNIGGSSKWLKHISIKGCMCPDAGADALKVYADKGVVSGNYFENATGDAIDLGDSEDLSISNNICNNATTYGIDASGTTDCRIFNNDVTGAGTGIYRAGATTLISGHNIGDLGTLLNSTIYKRTVGVAGASDTEVFSYTVPADTLTKHGDSCHIVATATGSGTPTGTLKIKVGGGTYATLNITANGAAHLEVRFAVNSNGPGGAGNIDYIAMGIANGGSTAYANNNSTTTDFTGDVAISITVSKSAGTVTSDYCWFMLLDGEGQA
jgi:parallel beta-helix repeat protein